WPWPRWVRDGMFLFLLPRGRPRRRQEQAAQARTEVQRQKGHMALETRSRSTWRRHTKGTQWGMPAGRVTGATSSPASAAEPRYRHSCLVPASVTAAPSSPKLIFGASLACPANPIRTRVSLVPDAGRWRCRMGLMDRVREQAAQVAQRTAQVTQEAALQGKAKLDQAQAKRRADAMFPDLRAP